MSKVGFLYKFFCTNHKLSFGIFSRSVPDILNAYHRISVKKNSSYHFQRKDNRVIVNYCKSFIVQVIRNAFGDFRYV